MPVPKFATVLGALLLSRGGRRLAGRHAGKLALATLAFQFWERRRNGPTGPAGPAGPAADLASHPRRRWSGRR